MSLNEIGAVLTVIPFLIVIWAFMFYLLVMIHRDLFGK